MDRIDSDEEFSMIDEETLNRLCGNTSDIEHLESLSIDALTEMAASLSGPMGDFGSLDSNETEYTKEGTSTESPLSSHRTSRSPGPNPNEDSEEDLLAFLSKPDGLWQSFDRLEELEQISDQMGRRNRP